MGMKLLASGVDTLNLSVKAAVRQAVWDYLGEAQAAARDQEEAVPVEFERTGQGFNLAPYGRRGYAYLLISPDYEVMVGRSDRFPTVLVEMRSAFLHSMGLDGALSQVELFLRHDLLTEMPELKVSRIDLYADFQGWRPELSDAHRFVTFARSRRAFEQAPDRHDFMSGLRLTGFQIGKGDLMARIYDKTEEIKRQGKTWLPDLWGKRCQCAHAGEEGEFPAGQEHPFPKEGPPPGGGTLKKGRMLEAGGEDGAQGPRGAREGSQLCECDLGPVWRVEFQMRREVLNEFNLGNVTEVLAATQDLWRYATKGWLTYRTPTPDRLVRRWPVDPVWKAVQEVEINPGTVGVVRQRLEQANLTKLVQGLGGYLSSLAALRGRRDLHATVADMVPLIESYMRSKDRDFRNEVLRKLARLLQVTSWEPPAGLDLGADLEDAA